MSASNEQFVHRWLDEVWNRGIEASLHKYFHPQAVGHLEGAGDVHGPQGLLVQWKLIRDALPDFHIRVEEMISHGEDVVFRWTFSGTHRGDAFGFPATGRNVDCNGLTWLKVRNGQVVEGWDRWNQAALLQRLQEA